MIDTFEDLENFVTRKLAQVQQLDTVRDSLEIAIGDQAGEVREAAAMFLTAGELSKIYKQIRDACQVFLKSAIEADTKQKAGNYRINHYHRNVFDKSSWEHFAQTDEDLNPLWAAYQELESYKKQHKEEFQYLDSSVRVSLEVENEEV